MSAADCLHDRQEARGEAQADSPDVGDDAFWTFEPHDPPGEEHHDRA